MTCVLALDEVDLCDTFHEEGRGYFVFLTAYMRHENAQVEKLSKADEPLPYSVKVVEMNL